MAKDKSDEPQTQEDTVAKTIDKAKDIDAGATSGIALVQSTTESTPAEADKTPGSPARDAKPEDPPVRASKPDTPIAQTLAAGSGAHTPPDPDEFAPSGRPRSVEES